MLRNFEADWALVALLKLFFAINVFVCYEVFVITAEFGCLVRDILRVTVVGNFLAPRL